MIPEPLKNKIKRKADLFRGIVYNEAFFKEDIKSAVEWLKKESRVGRPKDYYESFFDLVDKAFEGGVE